MAMIVREMIMLEKDIFEPPKDSQFSDDSGWLGPPRAVPFSWEVAPGTPKQERSTEQSNSSQSCTTMVKYEPQLKDAPEDHKALVKLESGRHSIHMLDNAPRTFMLPQNTTVELSGELSGLAVPFKWEMMPGIPRDPDKCRMVLDCPLTPPPVPHSRSMIVHSSSKSKHMSLSGRMRSLLWSPPSPKSKKKPDRLMLKNGSSPKFHVNEEDLSPVSVLEYNSSVKFQSRLSSASSSYQTPYHTPKTSFSWESSFSSRASSSRGSPREPSKKRNSLSTLMKQNKGSNGCLMVMNSGNRSSSFNTSYSNEDSSEKSLSLSDSSSTEQTQKSQNEEASDGEGEDVYYSPLPYHLQQKAEKDSQLNQFNIVERVDSLETLDPGFAPSELSEDGYQGGILNRMKSCARWQRRQSSTSSKRSGSQLARSLFGRVVVCCYVPSEEDDHHHG